MKCDTIKLVDIRGRLLLETSLPRSTRHYRHEAISFSGAAEPALGIHTVHRQVTIARTERMKKVRGQPCLRAPKVMPGCRVDKLINKYALEKVPRCDCD